MAATDLAGSYRRLALALIDAGVGDYPCCSNELTVARMSALEGQWGQATEYFARARRTLEGSGQRPLRAILNYDETLANEHRASSGGQRMPARQTQASEASRSLPRLDAAEVEFGALEMPGWLTRARDLRRRVLRGRAGREPGTSGAGLTRREREVFELLAAGHSNKQVADQLVLSARTVEHHIASLYVKLGVHGRSEAIAWALRRGPKLQDSTS